MQVTGLMYSVVLEVAFAFISLPVSFLAEGLLSVFGHLREGAKKIAQKKKIKFSISAGSRQVIRRLQYALPGKLADRHHEGRAGFPQRYGSRHWRRRLFDRTLACHQFQAYFIGFSWRMLCMFSDPLFYLLMCIATLDFFKNTEFHSTFL